MADTFTDYRPEALPPAVTTYLDARDGNRHDDAASVFAEDATVIDDGHTYDGIDAIRAWITSSSTEFEYTTTRTGQRVVDAQHAEVCVLIEGTFPGGRAELVQSFELVGDAVRRLFINA